MRPWRSKGVARAESVIRLLLSNALNVLQRLGGRRIARRVHHHLDLPLRRAFERVHGLAALVDEANDCSLRRYLQMCEALDRLGERPTIVPAHRARLRA